MIIWLQQNQSKVLDIFQNLLMLIMLKSIKWYITCYLYSKTYTHEKSTLLFWIFLCFLLILPRWLTRGGMFCGSRSRFVLCQILLWMMILKLFTITQPSVRSGLESYFHKTWNIFSHNVLCPFQLNWASDWDSQPS